MTALMSASSAMLRPCITYVGNAPFKLTRLQDGRYLYHTAVSHQQLIGFYPLCACVLRGNMPTRVPPTSCTTHRCHLQGPWVQLWLEGVLCEWIIGWRPCLSAQSHAVMHAVALHGTRG